ncbi:hypothetical protein Goklo_003445, partial [Gossypium klotzschianum]|nr:hypothetical protein [Gossypium klotzschianum]
MAPLISFFSCFSGSSQVEDGSPSSTNANSTASNAKLKESK